MKASGYATRHWQRKKPPNHFRTNAAKRSSDSGLPACAGTVLVELYRTIVQIYKPNKSTPKRIGLIKSIQSIDPDNRSRQSIQTIDPDNRSRQSIQSNDPRGDQACPCP